MMKERERRGGRVRTSVRGSTGLKRKRGKGNELVVVVKRSVLEIETLSLALDGDPLVSGP